MIRCRALLVPLLLALAGPLGAGGAKDFLKRPAAWFHSAEASAVSSNILSWQSKEGSWPKNTDTTRPYSGEPGKLSGTFDNGATTDELRFLARLLEQPGGNSNAACSNAFQRGLTHIFQAQYANGGWPQYSPPPANKYHRHITFNDNSMVRLLIFLREVATEERYRFLPAEQRATARLAFDRGVRCILQCQVRIEGRLTAWCAQHDEVDFRPRPARAFELAALSGAETVGIVELLMSLDRPGPEVIQAVEAAVAWLKSAQIPGIKLVDLKDATQPKGHDKVVVADALAKPMWARFYELETGRPIYAGRDGVKKYALAEIDSERRNGYSWLGYWPETLLARDYPAWKASKGSSSSPAAK